MFQQRLVVLKVLARGVRSVQPNLNQWDEGHEEDEDDIDIDEAFEHVKWSWKPGLCCHEMTRASIFLKWGHGDIQVGLPFICQDSDPHWHYRDGDDGDEDTSFFALCLPCCDFFFSILHCQRLYIKLAASGWYPWPRAELDQGVSVHHTKQENRTLEEPCLLLKLESWKVPLGRGAGMLRDFNHLNRLCDFAICCQSKRHCSGSHQLAYVYWIQTKPKCTVGNRCALMWKDTTEMNLNWVKLNYSKEDSEN